MKIIKPYGIITSPYLMPNQTGGVDTYAMRTVEAAARISWRSEDAQTDTSWENFLRKVCLEGADWSVTEHVVVETEFMVDRGIQTELVRHRLASFTIESTRFVNYEKKMAPSFIYPIPDVVIDKLEIDEGEVATAVHDNVELLYDLSVDWLHSIGIAGDMYRNLLQRGWSPQNARSVFPLALAGKIKMTTNLRNWRHIFQQRTSSKSHPQMREVMIPLLEQFQARYPVLFEDIVPNESQRLAARKGR